MSIVALSEFDRATLQGIWLQLETLNNTLTPLLELMERQERRENERLERPLLRRYTAAEIAEIEHDVVQGERYNPLDPDNPLDGDGGDGVH